MVRHVFNLTGAKFGGYGSFLPSYERSHSIWSRPTPPRNKITAKSPNHFSTEVWRQLAPNSSSLVGRWNICAHLGNSALTSVMDSVSMQGVHFKAHAAVSPLGKPRTASDAPALHNSKVPPNDPLKQDLAICSELVTNCTVKEEISNRPGNQSDQRTLKVRLKMGCDPNAQKNAAIYSGLGLDNSPSTSLESSSGESEDLSASSGEIIEVSPASILQVKVPLALVFIESI